MGRMSKIVQSKPFDFLLTVLSLLPLAVIIAMLYWTYRPYNVIDWKIDQYEMQKQEYMVGEPLTFRTAFCKEGEFEATLTYHIEDGVTYLMPQQVSQSRQGCRDFISSSLTTPNLPTGYYKLRGSITYRVNLIRTITYEMESEVFKIVNPN